MLDLDFSTLISRIIVLLTAFSFHEFAHAWTANYFGDEAEKVDLIKDDEKKNLKTCKDCKQLFNDLFFYCSFRLRPSYC